jgi:hypothetical protein
MGRLQHSTDVGRGAWIAPRLSSWDRATGFLPAGYETYLRVFHPVRAGGQGAAMSWRQVCEGSGATWHPAMQWSGIVGDLDGSPAEGTLGEDGWAELARAISGDQEITAGLWIGYGNIAAPGSWPSSIGTLTSSRGGGKAAAHPPGVITGFDVDIRWAPVLELPYREYALFTGTLATLTEPGWRRESGWAYFWDQTLNLAWPADRSWFVASEIDLDSTLIGADAAVAQRILASSLEVAVIGPETDLTHSGDTINVRRC